ncbi:hypothetical protein COV11_03145 [Candidatus Woesearchaeota archaeon CG10_big_fil_rev_8_21_14_0_10_30_7]|nr:MAG: hypothetical protein COV11_03145 [Candidatus Woesearchaeota archaeon CG10_big_fil_rev_8_21_14_0_10_30_7]
MLRNPLISASLGALLDKQNENETVDVIVIAKGDAMDVYAHVFNIEAYFKDKNVKYNQEMGNSLIASLTIEQIYELSELRSVEYIDAC